jgi:Na+/phosphate symporter
METNKHDFKKSKAPLCPPGYILRNAYKTKNGKIVPDRCIKSTSGSNEKIKEKMKKYEKKLERKLDEVNKKIIKEYCNKIKDVQLTKNVLLVKF